MVSGELFKLYELFKTYGALGRWLFLWMLSATAPQYKHQLARSIRRTIDTRIVQSSHPVL